MLFGDSITQYSFRPDGWGTALADAYSRKADVVCRGFSGYNTRMARCLLPHCFPEASAQLLITTVFFGANDAVSADKGPAQHVPADEYRDNLAAIVAHVAARSRLVIVISPPPVDEAVWDGRSNAAVQAYTCACAAAAHPGRQWCTWTCTPQ